MLSDAKITLYKIKIKRIGVSKRISRYTAMCVDSHLTLYTGVGKRELKKKRNKMTAAWGQNKSIILKAGL
jgi:hypothetical protein